MKSSPKVVFKCKFTYGLNNPDNYLKNKFNYQEFLQKDINHLTDYFSDRKKEIVGMIDYYSGMKQETNVNLVLENGLYATRKQKQKLENDFLKATENSNLYKGVLSFDNDWINQKVKVKDLEQIFAKEVLPKFFKKCGFANVKNMRYCFSLHGNTNHLHIHLAFVEMKPNTINRDGKILYRRKGMISEEEKNFLKNEMVLAVERKSLVTPMITELNKEIESLKQYFKPNEQNFILKDIEDIKMEEKIIKLGFLIEQYRGNVNTKKIKYGSIKNDKIGKEIKNLTKELRHYLFFNSNSELYHQKEKVTKSLKKLNEYYEDLNRQNNIEKKIKNNQLVLRKEKYIDSFIMNCIVNHALYKTNYFQNIVKSKSSKNKILLDDLLQELALEKSKRFRNKNIKLIILQNNLTGRKWKEKNKLKHEICENIKKLNEEMESYANDFHKLFANNLYERGE